MTDYRGSGKSEKREFKRFEIDLHASLFYGNMVYSGVVTNLSKSGMFIRTKRRFALDSMLMASFLIDDKTIQVPVRIKRAVNYVDSPDPESIGVGVHILRSSREYLDFFGNYSSQQMRLTL